MADRFWVGGTGDWSDDTNHWATTTGGAPGGGNKPGASDTAIFDGNSGEGTCTLDEAPSITKLDMQVASVNLNTSGSDFAFTTSGDFVIGDISPTDFIANGSLISVGGTVNIDSTNPVFQSGTSTVDLTGTGNITNNRSDNRFYRLKCAASGFTSTENTTYRTRFLELGAGTYVTTGFTASLGVNSAGGDKLLTVNASATITGGAFKFEMPASGILTMDGFTGTTTNITFSTSGATTATLRLITRALSLKTVDADAGVIVDFNDQNVTTVQNIGLDGSANGTTTILFGSGTITVGNDIQCSSSIATTFNFETAAISCERINITDSACTVIPGTSSVTFDGGDSATLNLSGNSLWDVDINQTVTRTFTLGDALICNDFTHTTGTFTTGAGSNPITASGDFTVGAGVVAFNFNSSILILNGSALQTFTMNGETLFNVDNRNTSAGGIALADALDVNGTLTCKPDAGDALFTFNDTAAHTIDAFDIEGPSDQLLIQFRSSIPGNQFDITVPGDVILVRADAQDMNIIGGDLLLDRGADSGNNGATVIKRNRIFAA